MVYSYKHGQPAQQSNEIRDFQAKLNAIRSAWNGQWPRLTADGIYGRNTRDAVKAFQIFANVIPVSGDLDSATQTAINQKYIESKRTYSSYSASYGRYQLANANYTMGGDLMSDFDVLWNSHKNDIMSIVQDITNIIVGCASVVTSRNFKNILLQQQRQLNVLRGQYKSFMKLSEDQYEKLKNMEKGLQELSKPKAKSVTLWTNEYNGVKSVLIGKIDVNAAKIHKRGPNKKSMSTILKEAQEQELMRKVYIRKFAYAGNKIVQTERLISKNTKNMKALSKAGYLFDVWNVVYAASKWHWAHFFDAGEVENQKCRKEFKKAVENALSSIAVNATTDLAVAGAVQVAAKVGTGAAAGPVGIAITAVVGVLDIVLVMTTGESISDRLIPYMKQMEGGEYMDPMEAEATSKVAFPHNKI